MSVEPEFALYLAAGDVGTTHYVDSPNFTDFTPGQPLYLSFHLQATRVTGTNPCTVHTELQWWNAAGTQLATTASADIIVNATMADSLQTARHVPPAGAVKGLCRIQVTPTASPMQHNVWIKKLRLGKTELFATHGADWSDNVLNRPANLSALTGSEGINNALVPATDLNRIRFSQFEAGTKGWVQRLNSSNSGALSYGTNNGRRLIESRGSFTAAGQQQSICTDFASGIAYWVPATQGEWLCVQAWPRVDACPAGSTWILNVAFLYADGSAIDNSTVGIVSGAGTQSPESFTSRFIQAPAGASYCFLEMQLTSGGAGAFDFSIYNPMISGALAGQTVVPAFTPGPSTDYAATLGASWTGNVTARPANLAALAGNEGVNNGLISIGANGAMIGGGGGQVTIGGIAPNGLDDVADGPTYAKIPATNTFGSGTSRSAKVDFSQPHPNKLAQYIPFADGTTIEALKPAQAGATLGASWTGNVTFRPANLAALAGSEGIKNALVSIGSNGAMIGGGGGQVTIGGLGYTGDLNATHGADLLTNVSNKSLANLDPNANVALQRGATNHVFDGGFRLQGLNWTKGAGWTWVGPDTNRDGPYFYTGSATANVALASPFFAATNDPWSLQLETYTGGLTAGGLRIDLEYYDSNFNLINQVQSIVPPNGQNWTKQFAYGTPPATAVWLRVKAYLMAGSTLSPGSVVAVRRIKCASNTTFELPFTDEATNSVKMLTTPGSGTKVGDQRNLPAISSANLRYKFNGAISWQASSTLATISVTAGTMLLGNTGANLSLGAMSASVSGSANLQQTYQLYIINPNFQSGSFTLYATANGDDVYDDTHMWIGSVTVHFPTSGTTGTGSGYVGTGGGPYGSTTGGAIP